MLKLTKYSTIDEYVVQFPKEIQEIFEIIRSLVYKHAPSVEETISYGIPTFKLKGKNLIHFAGYENHIGIYPGSNAIEHFKEELKDFKLSKGTIQIPLDAKFPEKIVEKIIMYGIERIK